MPAAQKKDYYEVLGVNKNSTDDEIKKAYKKLAIKWHPDKFAKASESEKKSAEEKMKDINEAYDVLKDPKKRAQYDQFGHAGLGYDPRSGGGRDPFGGFEDIFSQMGGFGDIFGDLFGGGRRRNQPQNGPVRGADLRYDLSIDFLDAALGKSMTLKVPRSETCKECNGTGAAKGTSPEICPDCHGMGQRQTITRTPFGSIQSSRTCERCHGTGKIIKTPCSNCHGEGTTRVTKEINVNIPKGVDNGNRIRVQGGGNAGERGGQPGDLFVYINIRPHQIFKREGSNVYCEIPVSFVQAALGATIEAPTIDGKVDLKIPAGIQSGTVQKIKGKGIPFLRGEGRGDEFVSIKVLTPQNLTDRQKKLLQEFESGVDDNTVHPEKKNFIDKLKDFFKS